MKLGRGEQLLAGKGEGKVGGNEVKIIEVRFSPHLSFLLVLSLRSNVKTAVHLSDSQFPIFSCRQDLLGLGLIPANPQCVLTIVYLLRIIFDTHIRDYDRTRSAVIKDLRAIPILPPMM